ncbi:MAG: hypothetical protein ACPLX8_00420, partial [Nanopusillaceae archaeon]
MSYNDIVSQFLNYFQLAQSLDDNQPVIPSLVNISQVSTIQDTLQSSKNYYSNVLQQGYFSTPSSEAVSSILLETKAALDTITTFSGSNIATNLLSVTTLDNLLLSFGFTLLNLPYYVKQTILTNLVANYKIKGTLQSVFNMLTDITDVPIMIAELYFEKWFQPYTPDWTLFVQNNLGCLKECLNIIGVIPFTFNSLSYNNHIFQQVDPTQIVLNSSNYTNTTHIQVNSTTTINPINTNFNPTYVNVEFYDVDSGYMTTFFNNTNQILENNLYDDSNMTNYIYAVVLEPDYIYYGNNSTSNYLINHNLDSPYISLTCYDITNQRITYPDVQLIDNSNFTLVLDHETQIV